VGVTADTIRIGTINMTSATRSLGPALAGVQEQNLDAAVKYINRSGGVSGRKLQLVTCDDGGDISRGRACYEKLKGNVFALVPSMTWLTDVIHDRLPKDKIPWLSWGWFKSEYEDPWMFPCHANGMREATAVAEWTPGLDRVTCLFAGSVEHLMRDLFTPRQRAFYQFGGFHALAPIDVEDWRVGLVDRFAEDGCTVTPDALARLIELGEGHPRATMLVAQQTHDAAIADGTRIVDSGLVAVGLASAMAADRVTHDLVTERIRSLGRHTLVVARRVAQGQRAYPGLEAKTATRAVNALRDAGLIEQHGWGDWQVTDPLLRRYLTEL